MGGCASSQDRYVVEQCFGSDGLVALISISSTDGTLKGLAVYDGKELFFDAGSLKRDACDLVRISGDTVFLQYTVFRQQPGSDTIISVRPIKREDGRSTKYVLVETDKIAIGSMLRRKIDADSIVVKDGDFLAYSKGGKVDTFDVGRIGFTGRDFYASQFRTGNQSLVFKQFFEIDVKDIAAARRRYYDYVNQRISGNLNEILGYAHQF